MALRRVRIIALVVVGLLAVLGIPAAGAHHAPPYPSGPDHAHGEMVDYSMIFPVQGNNSFTDTFYASRCCSPGEIHHATDIMSAKMTPIVAPVSGTIESVNWSHNPDSIDYSRCCTLSLDHDDGIWESWYIHINNDTPGTDDGKGALGPIVNGQINPAWGVAPGIVPGVHVDAGQLLGWVGDSGNAEGTSPHLHFELMDDYNVRVNPYQALKDARAGLYQPCPVGQVVCRVAGSDRYSTATESSRANFPNGADIVFIATGLAFPDALAGGPVAAQLGAPLLLVAPDSIPGPTATELARLDPSQLIVLGGESAVSAAVATGLEAYGSVIRLAGANRYATAAAISQFSFPDGADTVVVATGIGFADALAGGPAAAKLNGVVLLTQPGTLPPETLAEITRLDPDNIIVIGGTAAVSAAVESTLAGIAPTTRISGADRYATAAAISAAVFPSGVANLHIAVGTGFPDALTGGAAAGLSDSPLLIANSSSLPTVIQNEILRLDPRHVTVLGGFGVVGQAVQTAITALVD
jgi:putative cell wall-binding protein